MELAIAVIVVLSVVAFAAQLCCYMQYYKALHPVVPKLKAEVAASLC
ncbi:MAG TPA: hypothetical protein VIU41_09320 [Geobacteraceae bacterium]